MKKTRSRIPALMAAYVALLPCSWAGAQNPNTAVTIAPKSSEAVKGKTVDPAKEVSLTQAQKLALLQKNIKYVFVLFQENRSFDFYFGTLPWRAWAVLQPPAQTPGFYQKLVNTDGYDRHHHPFNIPQLRSAIRRYQTGPALPGRYGFCESLARGLRAEDRSAAQRPNAQRPVLADRRRR